MQSKVLVQGARRCNEGFQQERIEGEWCVCLGYKGNRLIASGTRKDTAVSMKIISATSGQGALEFEVKIIGQVQHRNLMRVLGWCHERGELLQVYEIMPNGSLDQHLFSKNNNNSNNYSNDNSHVTVKLTWARRVNISSGIASALAYLHDDWKPLVFHGWEDVKCSNIMLDSNFNACLGDFGLARITEHDRALTALAGTGGYLAPELAQTFKATTEKDVYSFGAVDSHKNLLTSF